jgi:hypothetical protein
MASCSIRARASTAANASASRQESRKSELFERRLVTRKSCVQRSRHTPCAVAAPRATGAPGGGRHTECACYNAAAARTAHVGAFSRSEIRRGENSLIRVSERRGHVGAAARVWLSSMHDRQIRSFKIGRHSQRAAQNRQNRYRRQAFTSRAAVEATRSINAVSSDEIYMHCPRR